MESANPVKQKTNTPVTAWAKGQSGNPNGRPRKMTPDGRSVAEIARAHTDLAITVLVGIATESESDPARVTAANSLLDRGWGKPTQPVGLDGDTMAIAARLIAARSRVTA